MRQAIIIKNKKQCKEVMDVLFDGGIKWSCNEGKYDYLEYPNYREIYGKRILYASGSGDDILKSIDWAQEIKCEIITANKFLDNPSIIDGWKKSEPEKMLTVKGKEYSESTLQKALEEYIK